MNGRLTPLTLAWMAITGISLATAAYTGWTVVAEQTELEERIAERDEVQRLVDEILSVTGCPQKLPIPITQLQSSLSSVVEAGTVELTTGRSRPVASSRLFTREISVRLRRVAFSDAVSVLQTLERQLTAVTISQIEMTTPTQQTAAATEVWDVEVVLTQVGDEAISSAW